VKPNRLEAFSDGVIAIIITIMVLELRVPEAPTLTALAAGWPTFLSYLLSFTIVAIYWINHHLVHLACRVDPPVLWANTNLLFWMSLMPFVTAWMGESRTAPWPTAAYALVATLCSISFFLLRAAIARQHEGKADFAELNAQLIRKNLLAIVIYVSATAAALVLPALSLGLCALPALMYFLPERHAKSCPS